MTAIDVTATAVLACLSCRQPSPAPVCATCADPSPVSRTPLPAVLFLAGRIWVATGLLWVWPGTGGDTAAALLLGGVTVAGMALGAGHFAHRDQTGIAPSEAELGEPCDAFTWPEIGRCVGLGYPRRGQQLVRVGRYALCPPCAVAHGVNVVEVTA